MLIILIAIVFVNSFSQLYGQTLTPDDLKETPYFFQKQFFPKSFEPTNIKKIPGH
jgi:hypothetical protein